MHLQVISSELMVATFIYTISKPITSSKTTVFRNAQIKDEN